MWMTAGMMAMLAMATPTALSGQVGGGQGARGGGQAGAARSIPPISERTSSMQKIDGFFPLYWDEASGSLFLEIPTLGREVLYVSGLSAGVGSNDLGLDRAQLGGTAVVSFQRVGPRVLMVQPNYEWRANSENPAERKAMEDAFAKSVLWGFTVAAEGNGRVLVDFTDFIMRDTHNVGSRIGGHRFDRTRSAVNIEGTKGFPSNTEIDVISTFVNEGGAAGGRGGGGGGGGQIGGRLGDVAPNSAAVTVRQHHSIIELPDNAYTPRMMDPRSGYFGVNFADYAKPLGEDLQVRYINRHRLVKKDPNAARSEPVEPIIYYVDRGAPEPIRTALIEGGRWWNEAFEAAGFINAFRVEVMPEGADPMDVRYNTITWVHRSTRGWSYGSSITDPRTGEILKGHVSLGSLRWRQDYLIFEGLLSPYVNGNETPAILEETALARIRQLSAHEIGHTIGLGHNYYNSSAGRISVLDYPHPLITLRADGTMDLSQAYDVGIGEWDKVAIQYGYSQFAAGTDEAAELKRILDEAWDQDIRYMSNQDLDLNPGVDQWNNGTNEATELNRLLQLRRAAMEGFGERAIKVGRPMALIEEALVPVYLHHRYAVDAAVTALGGQEYIYAMRGDGRTPVRWAPAARQTAALDALMNALRLSDLTLPSAVVQNVPPRPPGFGNNREMFPRLTGGAFDPVAPAVAATEAVLGGIFSNTRAARLVAQKAIDGSLPGLEDVLDRLVATIADVRPANGYESEINRAMERALVSRIMGLAESAPMTQVRAIATDTLKGLQTRPTLAAANTTNAAERAHRRLLQDDITRFLDRPYTELRPPAAPQPPPGAPIGDYGLDYLLGLDYCRVR
jgi:hypothetical protein